MSPQRGRWPVSDAAAPPGREDTWSPSDAGEAVFRAGLPWEPTHHGFIGFLASLGFHPLDRPSDLSSKGPEVVTAGSQSLGVPSCRRALKAPGTGLASDGSPYTGG